MPDIKIVPTRDLDEAKKNHEQSMRANEDYRNACENISFKKGRKLLLEVEVTDPYLSSNLFQLLNNKIEGQDFLGFKINTINLDNTTSERERLINKLEMFISQLK